MASGTITKKWYGNHSLNVEWSSVSNAETNSSVITAKIKMYCPYSLHIGARKGTITIDSVSYSFNGPAIDTSGGTITLGTITSNTIPHNTDGTKTTTISCIYPIRAYMGSAKVYVENATCSGNATLDTILRQANLTGAPNFYDEANPTITYSNPLGNGMGGLKACISSRDGATLYADYRDISKTGTSYTFNLTNAEREALRNASLTSNTLELRFTVKSIIGSDILYSSLDRTMTIINGAPIISNYAATDEGDASLTGSNTTIISGVNYINVSMNIATRKNATIEKYRIYAGNVEITGTGAGAITGALENVKSGLIFFEATDSRGNVTKESIELSIVDYFNPTISMEVSNVTTEGTCEITLSGYVFQKSFGAVENPVYLYYSAIAEGGTSRTWVMVPFTVKEDNSYKVNITAYGLDYKQKYSIQGRIVDAFNDISSNEVSVKAIPVFDWGPDDFAFYVPISIEGAALKDFIIDQGTSGDWMYRKWKSGFCELWLSKTINTTITNAWGNLYTSGQLSSTDVNFPFTFAAVPIVNVSLAPNGSSAFIIASENSHGSTTSTGLYKLARGSASSSSLAYKINYYVMGTLA